MKSLIKKIDEKSVRITLITKILLFKIMSKYWLVYTTGSGNQEDENSYYSHLAICDTQEQAIKIIGKVTDFDFDDENEGELVDHELTPYTIDVLKKSKSKTSKSIKKR